MPLFERMLKATLSALALLVGLRFFDHGDWLLCAFFVCLAAVTFADLVWVDGAILNYPGHDFDDD